VPSGADLTTEDKMMVLCIGPSGSGKTGFECSINDEPTYNFDFDGRIRGILGCPWIDRSKITYDSYPPRRPNLLQLVDQKLESFLISAGNGQMMYKNVVLDSLTSETFAMLSQAIALTHNPGGKDGKKTGKFIGTTPMADGGDYGFEATNTYNILSCLRSIPGINVFISAHVVKEYGKSDSENPYSPSIVIGEKLSLRDKISENIQIYFDHIWQFKKTEENDGIHYWIKFRGEIARTAFAELPNGWVDFTGKSGKEILQQYLKRAPLTSGDPLDTYQPTLKGQ
jgi:hypothetical protein